MSEPVEQTPNHQAWINIWLDDAGGLAFEANSASTTQLLGMVAMVQQLIIQRALGQGDAGEAAA